jgi:hypothetical protein
MTLNRCSQPPKIVMMIYFENKKMNRCSLKYTLAPIPGSVIKAVFASG